jgi:cation diffusion facilitator CzcD-associated flavoprotein CzcO
MLQRSPGYIVSLPDHDVIADALRALLPDEIAHALVRAKNVLFALGMFLLCRWKPKLASRLLRGQAARHLPDGYPIEKHFTPRYAPWDQRLCLVPNADLFAAISKGRASVATDTIETFTAGGVRLASGEELPADVVVTATGLKVLPIGGVRLSVDGREMHAHDTLVYKGMMLGDVPNLAWCVGYTNASWTLRADLSSRFVCRLLNFMEDRGYDVANPRSECAGSGRQRLLGLTSGYIERAVGVMPQQGSARPWVMRQNYVLDFFDTMLGRIDDGALELTARQPVASAPEPSVARG